MADSIKVATHDGLITVEVTFNDGEQGTYPPETVQEMCEILEEISGNIRMALDNPEIRNAQPISGKES